MYIIEDNRVFTVLVIIGLLLLIFAIIRGIFRVIKWFFRTLWHILTGSRRQNVHVDYTQSGDWLTRSQARQEIRFKNSLPPLLSEAKPLKKTRKELRNERKGLSPTGWKFNEETQMWEPPKKLKK